MAQPDSQYWYSDYDLLTALGSVLIDVDVLVDANETHLYYSKPWKWDREYKLWTDLGQPRKGDPEYEQFYDDVHNKVIATN